MLTPLQREAGLTYMGAAARLRVALDRAVQRELLFLIDIHLPFAFTPSPLSLAHLDIQQTMHKHTTHPHIHTQHNKTNKQQAAA
jgi:hypothetical protein